MFIPLVCFIHQRRYSAEHSRPRRSPFRRGSSIANHSWLLSSGEPRFIPASNSVLVVVLAISALGIYSQGQNTMFVLSVPEVHGFG
ncbi:unnamed protein product [Linum trigynum]|uniref:Uncharacterized protein n=1 Tax=Linum trigynum TaxID=586398 RepID=A0AAV2DPR3_9ROSI